MLLFVYGTLMKDMGNDHILESCKYLGTAETIQKYSLYVSDFVIPKLINEPNYPIKGELYRIGQQDLSNILNKERKYNFSKIKVRFNGYFLDAFTFIFPHKSEKDSLLPQGDYRKYINDFIC